MRPRGRIYSPAGNEAYVVGSGVPGRLIFDRTGGSPHIVRELPACTRREKGRALRCAWGSPEKGGAWVAPSKCRMSARSERGKPPFSVGRGSPHAGFFPPPLVGGHWVDVGRELRGLYMVIEVIELFVICGGLVIPTPVILNGGGFFPFRVCIYVVYREQKKTMGVHRLLLGFIRHSVQNTILNTSR